jgi:hypothetical protein
MPGRLKGYSSLSQVDDSMSTVRIVLDVGEQKGTNLNFD